MPIQAESDDAHQQPLEWGGELRKNQMHAYVALLRAVNVGGTGKLPMQELRSMSEGLGFAQVQTYIASGNLLFASDLAEVDVKRALEDRLSIYAGRPQGVMVRSAIEMKAIVAANPFSALAPNSTTAIFLDDPPPPDTLQRITGSRSERVQLGAREIYVHYVDSMARSKLKIPAAQHGTARNMNTVARLAEMAGDLLKVS